jgi:hypothetical protein
MFAHDDRGQKALFYTDDRDNLVVDLLDSKGKKVKHISNTLKTTNFFVIQSSGYYVINACLESSCLSIFGQSIIKQRDDLETVIMLDMEFNYLRHRIIDYNITLMASNDANILYFNKDNFYSFNMDLKPVTNKALDKIRKKLEKQLIQDFVVNDVHLFILCANGEGLKIFDLNTSDLVTEIDVEADQIKLVLATSVILFNSCNKMLYLYNQCGDFEKLNQVDIKLAIDGNIGNLYLNADKSPTVLFYNDSQAKILSFNQLNSIPTKQNNSLMLENK